MLLVHVRLLDDSQFVSHRRPLTVSVHCLLKTGNSLPFVLYSSCINILCVYRYGVTSIGYPEQHIHNVMFAGFSVSSCQTQKSSAIAVNPAQIDQQAALLISEIEWKNVDSLSRFGFRNSAQAASACGDKPCSGTNMIMIHDLDGTVTKSIPGGGSGGQLLFNNPAYVAPSPQCSEMTDLGSGFFFIAAPQYRLHLSNIMHTGMTKVHKLLSH